jgi:hypothetical protein
LTIIEIFSLSELDGYEAKTTTAKLSLNEVELTDFIYQNPFKKEPSLQTHFFTIDSQETYKYYNSDS